MRSSSSSRTRFVSFHSFRAFWHFANKKKKKEDDNDDNGEETVKQEQQKQKGEKKTAVCAAQWNKNDTQTYRAAVTSHSLVRR